MKSISELQDLCNFAVSISKNSLMIEWIEFLKTQSDNKSIHSTYNLMISKLQQSYVSEFEDPYSIAETAWGIGSGEMFRPIPDIHEIYFMNVRNKINEYFINEIVVLNTDKGFQTKVKNIQNNLETFFTLPLYVVRCQASRKSTFHNIYGKYSTWLYDRNKTQDVINFNFENLKKLIDEYS